MRWFARGLVVASVAWLAAIVIAPYAIQSSLPGIRDLAVVVYGAGGFICHQRPERSFWLAGAQLPVCARCTGLYASAAIGAPITWLFAGRPSGAQARVAAILTGLPTLITWSLEMAGLAHPSNTVRAVAALPLGLAMAWLVVATTYTDPRRHDTMPRIE